MQLKQKVFWEPIHVPFHLLPKGNRLHSIENGEVPIQHDPLVSDDIDMAIDKLVGSRWNNAESYAQTKGSRPSGFFSDDYHVDRSPPRRPDLGIGGAEESQHRRSDRRREMRNPGIVAHENARLPQPAREFVKIFDPDRALQLLLRPAAASEPASFSTSVSAT